MEPLGKKRRKVPCYACNGKGRIVTKFGKEVLEFVRRHMFDDVLR